jgi:hypothetical protein
LQIFNSARQAKVDPPSFEDARKLAESWRPTPPDYFSAETLAAYRDGEKFFTEHKEEFRS